VHRHSYPNHRTEGGSLVVPAETADEQTRHTAIEVQGVRTFQPIAEQQRELVERYRLVADRKHDLVCIDDANAVADVVRGALRIEPRVDGAGAHQHWPGLRCENDRILHRAVPGAFHDPGADRRQHEHPVRFHIKISEAGRQVDAVDLASVHHQQAERGEVLAKHAGVHGKPQLLRLPSQRLCKPPQGLEGHSRAVVEEQLQMVGAHIDVAYRRAGVPVCDLAAFERCRERRRHA
jgi:hypothetical protein